MAARATIKGTGRDGVDGHTEYTIEVEEKPRWWTISKRYSDFVQLDQDLVQNSAITRRQLPPKGLFGLRHRMGLCGFNDTRQLGLQTYLSAILDQVTSISEIAVLGAFLEDPTLAADRPHGTPTGHGSPSPYGNVAWEVQLEGGWKPCDPEDSAMLEKHYRVNGQHHVFVTKDFSFNWEDHTDYRVDFANMTQTNLSSNNQRRIRRTTAPTTMIWECKFEADTTWHTFDAEAAASIEELYARKSCGTFDSGIYKYDFLRMTQTNSNTEKVVALQRKGHGQSFWEYKFGQGWKQFARQDSNMLENYYTNFGGGELQTSDLSFNKEYCTLYTFNFNNMTQTNLYTTKVREIRRSLTPASWEWRDAAWKTYKPKDASMLEDSYQRHGPLGNFTTRDFTFNANDQTLYKIDFATMTQTNLETKNVREICRAHQVQVPISGLASGGLVPVPTVLWFPGKGSWKDDAQSPVHVPVVIRNKCTPPSAEWLGKNNNKDHHGNEAEWWDLKDEDVQNILQPFPRLERHGTSWEKLFYEMVDHKLHNRPKDCSCFGINPLTHRPFRSGLEWEVESIRLIHDEKWRDQFCKVPTNGFPSECDLFFHGTKLQNLNLIMQNGFRMPASGSDQWYGNGLYFTNCLPYSQHYIGRKKFGKTKGSIRGKDQDTGFQLPRKGKTIYVVGALLKPGKVLDIPKDATPKGEGYKGPFRNKDGAASGYDSHVAHVSPVNDGFMGFRPVDKSESKGVEEWVIFETERILPVCIIGLTLISDGLE